MSKREKGLSPIIPHKTESSPSVRVEIYIHKGKERLQVNFCLPPWILDKGTDLPKNSKQT